MLNDIRHLLEDKSNQLFIFGVGLVVFLLAQLEAAPMLLLALLVVLFLRILVRRPKMAFPFAIASTPVSFYYYFTSVSAGLSLPAEPILIVLLILFVLQTLAGKRLTTIDHPVIVLATANLVWLFVTVFFSSMPAISLKYAIAQAWFIIPILFFGSVVFFNDKHRHNAVWWYVIPLSLVIVYTTIHHARFGFSELSSKYVMQPFFNDHTAYGAVSALFIPIPAIWALRSDYGLRVRIFSIGVLALLVLALFLSASRAAWLSMAVVLLVFIIFRFRIRWYAMGFVGFMLFAALGIFQNQIIDYMSKNDDVSSSDLTQHIKSMTNISTDVSNLERLNRWESAWLMFMERPITGFGPGTYMFQYAPYQRASSKTVISTNFGEVGNAHSEYIGPLAERGLLGMILVIALFLAIIYTGQQVWKHAYSSKDRYTALGITLGLISYMIHGFLNNFLDTDKLAVPFWMLAAILVAMHQLIKKQRNLL